MCILSKRGFTLIELLMVIAVMACLATATLPNSGMFGGRSQAWMATQALESSLMLARLKAMSTHQTIRFIPEAHNTHPHIHIQYHGFPNVPYVDILPTGEPVQNGSFYIRYKKTTYYRLVMGLGGRLRIE